MSTPWFRAVDGIAVCLAGLLGLVLLGGGFGLKPLPPAQAAASDDQKNGASRPRRDWDEDPYRTFVRRHFIDANLLVVSPDLGADSGVYIVDLAPEVYADSESVAFRYASESFLLDDIRRNDPGLWVIENGKVVDIASHAHHTPPPAFDGRKTWRGEIRYRTTSRPAADDVMRLVSSVADAPVVTLVAGRGVRTDGSDPGVVLGAKRGVGDLTTSRLELYCRPGDQRPAARIVRIGDQVGVSADDLSGCSVQVAGRTLQQVFEFEALGQGERIVLTRRQGGGTLDYQRRRGMEDSGVISSPTATGQRALAPELAWWADAIENDYVSAFQNAAEIPQEDVVTSLDRDLHLGVQRLLDAYMDAHPGKGGEMRIGAVTVMDALTGEVLAMATTPRAPYANGSAFDVDDDAARIGRLNQNLQLHPVGSAAKPLMAAAILRHNPDLATLQIQTSAGVESLLGFPQTPPLQNHPASGWIGFNRFIQDSDNIYAGALALLGAEDSSVAATCPLPEGEGYRLGGFKPLTPVTTRTRRPKSIFEQIGPGGECVPAFSEGRRQLRWADDLVDLFGVNIASRASTQADVVVDDNGDPDPLDCMAGDAEFRRFGDGIHDGLPWRHVSQRDGANICRFRASAPLREALGLDSARRFRMELLPAVLGNGDGLWSTIKLAEAYARLVTGWAVQARFTEGGEDVAQLPLRADLRAWITHAMTLVTAGTAGSTRLPAAADALEAALARQGRAMGLFAKTGTPLVVQRDYRPVDKAINLLIRQDRLRLGARPGELSLRLSNGELRVTGGLSSRDRAALARGLATDRVMIEARRRFGVGAATVIDILSGYAAQTVEGRQPFTVRQRPGNAPLLVRVADRRALSETAADPPTGKVVAFVVAAYDPRAPRSHTHGVFRPVEGGRRAHDGSAQPQRAYAVVVSLQYEIEGSANGAADLGGQILSELLTPRLLETNR